MNYTKLINISIYIYYFFTVLLVVTLKYEVLYLNTLIGIILILLILIYKMMINKNSYIKKYIYLKFICYNYCLFLFLQCIFINKNNIIYVIHKAVPIILLCNIIDYITLQSINIEILKKYICRLFICGIIFTLVLYILNISYIQIGGYFKYVTKSENIYRYREARLSGFFSHKSRFGVYCIIAMMCVLKQNNIKKYIRGIMFLLIILASFLSDSMTTFAALLGIIAGYFIINNINTIKSKVKLRHILLLIIILIIIGTIGSIFIENIEVLYSNRNFSNLGMRSDIWRYSIEYIKQNLYGTVKLSSDLALGGYEYMNNAHNIFLNEFIESGILGGILYITIFISYIFYIKDPYVRLCYLAVLACSQFDKMISNEFIYVFWGIYSIYSIGNNKIKKCEYC